MASDALQRIDENNYNPAVATLINAFSDDHIVKHLGLSQEMIKRMYEAPLKIGLRFGEVCATSDSCEGVMVFCPGERANLNLWEMIKNGMFFTSLSLIRLLANKDMRRLSMILERDKKNLKSAPFSI